MQEKVQIYFDGHAVESSIFIHDNRLMVPAILLKHTGTTVDWNDHDHSVLLKRDKDIFIFPSDKKYNRYIPLQDVAEKLGMKVSYKMASSRIYVSTQRPMDNNPLVLYRGDTRKKKAALTFDDGPDRIYTAQILDILGKKSVPATFFVIGENVRAFPQEFMHIVHDGHALGNHSWSHPNFSEIQTSLVIQEIQSTEMEIKALSGQITSLFRPPFGLFTAADALTINSLGFPIIMWSVDTLDWQGLSEEKIFSIVKDNISPGAIVLQHSIGVPPKLDGTIKALGKIIDYLHQQGYEFVKVSDFCKTV